MENFAEQIQEAAEESIVKTLKSGDWLRVAWDSKMTVAPEQLRKVYESVDMDRVAERLTQKLEGRIADAIFNNMATEVGTDVKKILSNTELREDVRSLLRNKMRATTEGLR
jgi:hypothetical protein